MEIASDYAHLRRETAVTLHLLGAPIIPLNGKCPVNKGWKSVRANQQTDCEVVEITERGNIGMPTGTASGRVVVDIDSSDVERVKRELGIEALVTQEVVTGGGGRQLHFVAPDVPLKNTVKHLHREVDTRGEGGQVVLPGSIHPETGKVYEWAVGRGPETPLAPVPQALLDRWPKHGRDTPTEAKDHAANLDPAARAQAKALVAAEVASTVEQLMKTPKGERNNTLNRAAYHLFLKANSGFADADEVEDLLYEAAVEAGLEPDEIRATLASARRGTEGRSMPPSDRSLLAWAVQRDPQRRRHPANKATGEEPEAPNDEGDLVIDKEGQPVRSANNVRVALRLLGAVVEYDEFANRLHLHVVGDRNKRWRGHSRDLDDAGLIALRIACGEEFGLRVGKDEFRDYVKNYAHRRRYHPVLEYLTSQKWDGKPRVQMWLHTYLSVPDSDYSRAVGQLLLVAAVRRVRKPGEKFDEMLLLEGPQGGLKSATLRVLAVRDEWFTDDLPLGADPKLVLERTQGCWIVEAGELSGMSKRGVADLKQFLSRGHDEARLAYDALTTRRLRSFVIVGTTNDDKYLKDLTGNRRFWPVRVGQVYLDELKRDVHQLWAEAAQLEAAGAPSRLDPSLYEAAGQEQAERLEDDPWTEELREKLVAYPNARVRSGDVWDVLGKPTAQQTQQDGTRLHRLLRHLGFENRSTKHPDETDNKTVRCWVRGDGSQPLRAVVSEPRVRRFQLITRSS